MLKGQVWASMSFWNSWGPHTRSVYTHEQALFHGPAPGANKKDWARSRKPEKTPISGKDMQEEIDSAR